MAERTLGWNRDYLRWRRYRDPAPTPEERFWAKVNKTETCWLWTAYITQSGYGQFRVGGSAGMSVVAHRVAYEWLVGPISKGLTLDHLCRVRHCVRPTHLEPVTNRENILRGTGMSARHARKTHCIHGHPFDAANTHVTKLGRRHCRTCHRERERRRHARLRPNQFRHHQG